LLEIIKTALEKDVLDPQIVRFLVQRHPQVTQMRLDTDDSLLLHIACWYGAPLETIQLLLDLYPDAISIKDDHGEIPLHSACDNTEPSFETIELLISQYPDAVHTPKIHAMLPLHLALQCGASTNIIMTLLNHFPDAAKHVTGRGKLALHYALGGTGISFAPFEVIKQLVELKPEGVQHVCDQGALPLHYACGNSPSSLEVVKFLVDQYTDGVKTQNDDGCLPLHCAVYHGSLDTIQLLIESYPDAVKAKDNHGKLVLHAACESGASHEVIELLIDCYNGEESHRSGLTVIDNDGCIPLHAAALGRSTVETMQLLLEQYPEGTNAASRTGAVPLHIASASMNCSIQHILLGDLSLVSVLQKTAGGHTALELAAERQTVDRDTVALLLEKQNEAVQSIRVAFDNVVGNQLGFPDLMVAQVWTFTKPDLWQPTEADLTGGNESVGA